MHDNLTDRKVKKNVDTITNDPELMNAEVEVPKGIKKVLKELVDKLKALIKELTEPYQVAGQAALALSYAASAFVTKTFSEKEYIKASDLNDIYNGLEHAYRDARKIFDGDEQRAVRNQILHKSSKVAEEYTKHRKTARNLDIASDILTSLRNMQVIVVAALSAIASGRYIKNKIKK